MTLFIVPTVTCNIYFSSKVAKHAKQHMLTKLSQWVSMQFCSLLHGFLFKSHDLRCYIKPRRYSLFYISIKAQDYVINPHQVHLSKTTKHWDGFVSHCRFCLALDSVMTPAFRLKKKMLNMWWKCIETTETICTKPRNIISFGLQPQQVNWGHPSF